MYALNRLLITFATLSLSAAAIADVGDTNCPSGLTYINNGYGQAPQGGSAFQQQFRINLPKDFVLDQSYRQSNPVTVSGGGATSYWDGSNVPNGIYLETGGGYYWSVGSQAPAGSGFPQLVPLAMTQQADGSFVVGQWQLQVSGYCGPAGGTGGGCNVKVKVCAKERTK